MQQNSETSGDGSSVEVENIEELSLGDEVKINDRCSLLAVNRVFPDAEKLNVHGGDNQYINGAAALTNGRYEYTLYQSPLGEFRLAVASGAVAAGRALPKKKSDRVERMTIEVEGQKDQNTDSGRQQILGNVER